MAPVTSISDATFQAVGFATTTVLCWLVALMRWTSDRESGSKLYPWVWIGASLWPAGSFVAQVLLLAGIPADSRTMSIVAVVAWSTTCLLPPLTSRVMSYEFPAASRFRTAGLALSIATAPVLLVLFIGAAFVQGFPLAFNAVMHLSAYNFVAHALSWAAMYGAHQRRQRTRGGPRSSAYLFSRATAAVIATEAALILGAIFLTERFAGKRYVDLASQQMLAPAAIICAGSLAKSRYADVLLKRSLAILASVLAGSLTVWWTVPPGFPRIWTSLGIAGLLLATPSFERLSNRFIDRALLQRPDYAAIALQFADGSRRTGSPDELFGLAKDCIEATLEIATTRAGQFFDVTPAARGRRLMHEELAFLHAIRTEVNRRLEAFEFERQRRKLELRETEAQLKALRAQVDPHFLFNTLNTIAALIATDPRKAESMTERLAEFFRYTLAPTDRALSTLDEELEFVRHYLEIEQVRFGERLQVEISREDLLGRHIVPALILQPLVENAIRHGLAPKPEGGRICVSAACKDHLLQIQVADDGLGIRNGTGNGIGLQNVRDRLCAMYGDRARMDIGPDANGHGTCVRLVLPIHENRIIDCR